MSSLEPKWQLSALEYYREEEAITAEQHLRRELENLRRTATLHRKVVIDYELQERHEAILRKEYPTLREAWENYQTILAAVGGHPRREPPCL